MFSNKVQAILIIVLVSLLFLTACDNPAVDSGKVYEQAYESERQWRQWQYAKIDDETVPMNILNTDDEDFIIILQFFYVNGAADRQLVYINTREEWEGIQIGDPVKTLKTDANSVRLSRYIYSSVLDRYISYDYSDGN